MWSATSFRRSSFLCNLSPNFSRDNTGVSGSGVLQPSVQASKCTIYTRAQCFLARRNKLILRSSTNSETAVIRTSESEENPGPELETVHEPRKDSMKDNPIALPPDRRELWKAAIKIPMYSVAVVPITVGSAAAFLETGKFAASQFGGVLLASLLIIAWLNLSNDAFDAETDVDKGKPESVVNLLGGNRRAVLLMSLAAFAAGAGIMAASLAPVVQADPRVGAWLAAAVACGYVYQGPPFRLSYKGLGEPLCFAAFGPLATGAFYLAQRFAASPGSAGAPVAGLLWLCSAIVGVTTSAILFCSHFHQISGDRAAGKMSPLVRLGGALGARVLNGAVAAPYMALAVATATGAAPWPLVAASAVSLPAAVFLVDFVTSSYSKPEVVRFSKLHAISWHVAFGFSLTAALVFLRFAAAMPWIAVTLPS